MACAMPARHRRVLINVLRSVRSLNLPPRENRRMTEERGEGERAIPLGKYLVGIMGLQAE